MTLQLEVNQVASLDQLGNAIENLHIGLNDVQSLVPQQLMNLSDGLATFRPRYRRVDLTAQLPVSVSKLIAA